MQRVLLLQLIICICIDTQSSIAQSPDYPKFLGFCVGALGLFALSVKAAQVASAKQHKDIVILGNLKKQAKAHIESDTDYTQEEIDQVANTFVGPLRKNHKVKQTDCCLKLGRRYQAQSVGENDLYEITEKDSKLSYAHCLLHDIKVIKKSLRNSGLKHTQKHESYWRGASFALACAGAVGAGLVVSSLKGLK